MRFKAVHYGKLYEMKKLITINYLSHNRPNFSKLTFHFLSNIKEENKDKLPEEAKEEINKLINASKELKNKEDVTKEEIDKEIEKIQKEFQELYQKYQAEIQNTGKEEVEATGKDKKNDDEKDEAPVD